MDIQDIQLKQGDAYLSNPNLKRANTPIQFTEEQIIEFLTCKEDPVYFAKKYIKIVNVDDGLVKFNMWPFQERLVSNFHKNRFNICKMPRQCGKSLALDTPIPTPEGWTTIGNIKVGDQILSPDGNSVSVTFKTETMFNHQCYKIFFDNGEEIVADADHLWEVNSSYWRTGKKVINTDEIYSRYLKKNKNKRGKGVVGSLYIEFSNPIKGENRDLPIDPYLLGVWLGDGYSSSGRVVAHKDDYEFYKTRMDIEHEREDGNCIRFKCRGLLQKLKENNLFKNKHIPQIYLRSSIDQRMELLRGLMDTDGSITKNQSFEFYQKNYEFILQVVELLSSLGIKSRVSRRLINQCWYHTVRFPSKENIFNLPRKSELINFGGKGRPQNKRHYIQKIEKVGSVPVACIQVDSDDHLFLCGRTFIPTHNTTTVVSYLLHYIVFNDNVNVGILANKASTSREILSRLQLSYENLPKWMQQGIVSWNKGSLELENGSKIIAASTSASAVRGMSFNIIFLDEFAFVPNHIADDFFASVYPTISSGKSTKVIVVSCVTKDTYLLTDKGYRKIESFIDSKKSGAYIVPEYRVRGKDKFYSSDIIVNNKKSPTNIIKTRYETLECSENHKIWSFKDGKYDYFKSNELSVGDYVAIKYNHQVFGNDDYIGFQPEKEKCTNTFSCDYVNEDIAYFVGLYVSEGYARDIIYKNTTKIRGGQIVISCGDDISESLDKINVLYKKTDNVHYVINSKQLVGFLQELGFDATKKAKEKVLPEKILSWSKKNITALLRGMFDGDGGITKKGIVNYTSTSRELIRQVQLLLANIGILGSIYTTTSAPTKKVKVSSTNHTIEITGKFALEYFNQIGFNLSRKQERISSIKSTNRVGGVTDIVPNSAFVLKECGITRPSGRKKGFSNYSRQLLLSQKETLCKNEKIIEFFEDNVREDLIWLKIKDITKGEAEVFDVSLPDIEGDKWSHSVLYNNFLGHQTPKGMNHFYRMWHDAERGKNSFVATDVHWSEVPGRDEEWKAQTIANTSEEQFRAEHLCEFLGSVGTLINPSKLKILVYDDPIKRSKGLDVYENPIEDHSYLITVDVARGMGNDYSAFVVFDITEFPYRVVAKYKNNEIKPMLFPSIINEVAGGYDNAWLLIEVNDIGDQVANILHYDLEYDNILMCSMRGRAGQLVGSGFSGKRSQLGVRTTAAVKKLGCSNLKLLIEDDKLSVSDYDIISELTTFAQRHNSFEAEEGCNDDLVMCLVIFAWLVAQDYFKEMTNNDIRKRIYEEQKNQIDQDMAPFGFISDGLEDMEVFVEKETGDRWMIATSENGIQTQDIWNVDEYGDVSNEWDYR